MGALVPVVGLGVVMLPKVPKDGGVVGAGLGEVALPPVVLVIVLNVGVEVGANDGGRLVEAALGTAVSLPAATAPATPAPATSCARRVPRPPSDAK